MSFPLRTGPHLPSSTRLCGFIFLFYFNVFYFFKYATSDEEKAVHLTGVEAISRKSSSGFRVWCVWWVTRENKQRCWLFLKPYSLSDRGACSSLPSSLFKDWRVPDALTASYSRHGWGSTSCSRGAAKPEPFVTLGNPHRLQYGFRISFGVFGFPFSPQDVWGALKVRCWTADPKMGP